jgi:hypothetical protein
VAQRDSKSHLSPPVPAKKNDNAENSTFETMMASLIPVRNKRKLDDLTSSSASTSLTDLSDELLTLILENLDFRKRSVTRRVCRTLCRVADSLPPPEELQVEFFRSEDTEQTDPYSFEWDVLNRRGHCLSECNNSTTKIDVLLDHPHIGAEEDYLLQLRAIRPVHLYLGATSGLSGELLRRVADQVAGTVTRLSVLWLETESPLALYDAFSPFRNNGRLTNLCLGYFSPIRSVLFAVTTLTSLVKLRLVVNPMTFPEWNDASLEQAQGFGLELTALQSLPSLRELSIRVDTEPVNFGDIFGSDDLLDGFMLGCSALHQIRVLSYEIRFDSEEEHCEAFALMLSRLENLKELSKLCFPSEMMWSHVHWAGGHSTLQKIRIHCQEAEEAELEATVRAIVRDFPALVTLELELFDHICVELGRTAEILSGLKCHSSMTNVAVFLEQKTSGVDAGQVDDFLQMLQKDLGPKILASPCLREVSTC